MKLRLLKTVSFVFAVIFLFSGCSLLDFFSADSLLRAPKLTGENAALQQAFENVVGKDISLFTPISGEYRASYILVDIDNDKTDEAVVFYALNNNISVVHMHILKKSGEIWSSVADIVGSGTSVYKVDFFNTDDDKNLEVAVTWMVEDSKKGKTLSLYKISGESTADVNAITSIATIQLAEYICFDIDDDSINEILYLYFDTSGENEGNVSARLLDYDVSVQNLLPVSDLTLNNQIASFVQILASKSGKYRNIFVDAMTFDGKLFTEVIVYDPDKAVLSVSQLDGSAMSVFTQRDSTLLCCDYNNDGQYDIPLELEYEKSGVIGSTSDIVDPVRYVSWNSYREGILYESSRYFINFADGYEIKIDDFFDECYIIYDSDKHETQIRSRSYYENDLLFTIRRRSSDTADGLINSFDSEYVIVMTSLSEALGFTKNYVNDLISEKGWFY